jgi:hypothetical protein
MSCDAAFQQDIFISHEDSNRDNGPGLPKGSRYHGSFHLKPDDCFWFQTWYIIFLGVAQILVPFLWQGKDDEAIG